MNRRSFISLAAGGVALQALGARAANRLPPVEVFKNPTCGCCGGWVDHLKAAGFPVKVTLTDDPSAARRRFGIPDRLGSCHTAVVGGYAIEGHVPAREIQRLLARRPDAIGLAVPDMPAGSPGMEVGSRQHPYHVLLIDRRGQETVFATYPKT
jgi:hypothetical protein